MAGSKVFLDTSGWIALLNASDALHSAADSLWKQVGRQRGKIITTDWIVAEAGNGMARAPSRSGFTDSVRRLLASPSAELIFVDDDLLSRALQLYSEREDKNWGLVDCASFLLMEREAMRDVFGTDRHFEQAGFHCLLPGA
jgi:predicted nucleic acid-binding protein